MFIKLIRYLCGYITVAFYGDGGEKLLTMLARSGISFWNIIKRKDNFSFSISAHDYKKLRVHKRKTELKLKSAEKHGAFFFFRKYKLRFGIPVGIAVFFLIIKTASLFIWTFDAINCDGFTTAEINEYCRNAGLYTGIKADKINSADLRDSFVMSSEKIAWASFNVQGSRLEINLTKIKDNSKDKAPSNLKATADGIIERINVTSGLTEVKVGDSVAKGQILVRGINDNVADLGFVKSEGEIIAKAFRKINTEVETEYTEKTFTGKSRHRYVFDFYSLKIPLYLGKIKKSADVLESEKHLILFGKSLPVGIIDKRYDFYDMKTVTRTEQMLETESERLLKEQLNTDSFIIKSVKNHVENGVFYFEYEIITEENIAYEDFLIINDAK